MSDHDENDHLVRIRRLEEVAVQLTTAISMAADQLMALYVVNAALAGVLRDQAGIDTEMVRTKVLEVLSDGTGSPNAIAHVNALLSPANTDAVQSAEDKERDRLREVARVRFRVIEGGNQGGDGTA